MKTPIRVLNLEDSLQDCDLARLALERDGFGVEMLRAETRREYEDALMHGAYDIIISDYTLPAYDGMEALRAARKLAPRTPFIFFSGTIGEESAIACIREGATDYVLKDRYSRLGPAVRRALREVDDQVQRQQAELKLQQQARWFRGVLENVLDIVAVIDPAGTIKYITPSVQTVLGYADETLFDTGFYGLVHPDDRMQATERLRDALSHPQRTVTMQLRVRHRDGSWRVLEGVGRSRLEEPAIAGVMLNLRDETERTVIERRMQEQAALLDKAQDAICVLDMDQHIKYWNHSAETLYGWRAAEVLDHDWLDLFLPDDRDQSITALKMLIKRRQWQGELRQTSKAGKPLIIESRWTLVLDAEGRPSSILIINSDITERKKLEERIDRAHRLESIGILLGGIAHDLNNALAPALMATRLLRPCLVDPGNQKLLDALEVGAQRSVELVRQVLSFARGSHTQHRLLEVRPLVWEIVKFLKNILGPEFQVSAEVPADAWPIRGDTTQIHQILLNLCLNARDAMPSGGRLRIGADNVSTAQVPGAVPARFVVISVQDTGTGIAPEIKDRIFEPFFTTKAVGRGTGLGLASVHNIVQSHGGRIEVESEPGAGSTFKIYLPAAERSAAAPAEVSEDLPHGRGELILVVDDEEIICEITRNTLENFGYEVLVAHDGTEALTTLTARPKEIKLILMDMVMPFMDGVSTVRTLRKLDPDVKVILNSGILEQTSETQLSALRIAGTMTKPFSAEQLLRLIDQVLHAG